MARAINIWVTVKDILPNQTYIRTNLGHTVKTGYVYPSVCLSFIFLSPLPICLYPKEVLGVDNPLIIISCSPTTTKNIFISVSSLWTNIMAYGRPESF